MGRDPSVHVWSMALEGADATAPLIELGKGFFYRAVCALEFSSDKRLLVAVNCDDYHSVGVFELTSGQLLATQPGQHGPHIVKHINMIITVKITIHFLRLEKYRLFQI